MDTIVDQRDGAAMGQIRSPSTQGSRRIPRRLVTASLTRRATLLGRSGQGLAVEDESQTSAHSRGAYHRMCAARMRFSVVLRAQNALFREGLQPECVFPHLGKRGAALRKSTLCIHRLTEKHTLAPAASPKTTFWTSCARSMTYICACTTTPISKSPRTTRASSADRVGWDSRKAIRTVRCRSPRRRPHPLSSLILST